VRKKRPQKRTRNLTYGKNQEDNSYIKERARKIETEKKEGNKRTGGCYRSNRWRYVGKRERREPNVGCD